MSVTKERLLILRGESGESQAELGRAIGVTNAAVSRWECGKNSIPSYAVIKLCKHFQVSADWLLGLTDERLVNGHEAD